MKLPAVINILRPGQWIKNLLVLAGFLFALADQSQPLEIEVSLVRTLLAFVIEAATTSALGGVIGILLGKGLSMAATQVVERVMGESLTVSPTLAAVALAFGISVGIGILFGYLPAKKAARLNPIDALHYD